MSAESTLKVFDVQGYSVHDGPGIRQTVFLKGCPLRCRWCHSPESQKFETEILWLSVKCIGCLRCVEACPTGARSAVMPTEEGERIKIVCDFSKCNNCAKCLEACPTGALYYCGEDHTVNDLMVRIEREKPFYVRSGGGVTVSGGECLYQSENVAELLKRCKEIEIGTAVDTTGFIQYDRIKEVLPYTDLFLYDIKHMNSDKHKEATDVPNELILENARKIAADGGRFHIRVPLVPNYNTDDENILAVRDFLLEIKDSIDLIQLLPYHNYGNVKYDRLSVAPPEFDTHAPDEELIEHVTKIFEDAGFTVVLH